MKFKKLLLLIFFININITLAQTAEQIGKYLSEPVGDKTYRKKGILDGNLIRTLFSNDGQVGSWPDRPSGEWPKGSGHHYIDGCSPIVSTVIVTPLNKQTVHPAQTSYREEVDYDPVTNDLWVTQPVPGYAASESEEPAVSTKPETWPAFWPKSLPNTDETWDGYWYGYFGRGVMNADLECYYVMDDSQDKEFTRLPYGYYPVAADPNRGGLGLRTEIRGFQWSHVLAEDIIFWHYDIVNMSDFNYDTTYFGFYCDTGVGGLDDGGDDNASYDTILDLAYAFDADGVAPPDNWETGYVGYAYLESPGNGYNGADDDADGMLDERRDDGIDNDHDWQAFTDVNGNGVWDKDANEPLNDDLGKDGVGPYDTQYEGPDEGEGDGFATTGEPNFDATDKDESDQIGLTSLVIERLSSTGPTAVWPKNDEVIWRKMNYGSFDTSLTKSNIQILFGSGPFPLKQYKRERFSVALVFGSNYADMIFNKETVQSIYNSNYNFTKPPYKPTLTAVAGNKKVMLSWNDVSEKSYDNFLRKIDFEGYLLYRSQEPEFNDIKVITDSKGESKYWKPIAQFDMKDGIKGADPVGINGAHFWRGDDTGLQHSYVDTNVTNGSTYYYALVAYDQGDPVYGTSGLIPTETTKIISQDYSGTITFVDINCAVMTPNAPSAGYTAPQISGDVASVKEGLGTGSMSLTLLDPSQVKENAVYKVKFLSSGSVPTYNTTSYYLTREMNSVVDTIFSDVDTSAFSNDQLSSPFDGLVFTIANDTIGAIKEQGFVTGTSEVEMNIAPDESSPLRDITWPADYEIEWLPDGQTYTTPFRKLVVPIKARNITEGKDADCEVFDNNGDGALSLGDDIVIIEYLNGQYKLTWRIKYRPPSNPYFDMPKAGDVFRFITTKPFKEDDYFEFSTKGSGDDKELAKNSLDKIAVVPNPYICTNAWENRNLNQTGRGERRIDFIHLPMQCTIRIYTLTGALLKTLEKTTGAEDGTVSWNLVTEDGMDVSFGLYIYQVDAPGVGDYIGKFTVIK
ncbi:MAG: hypothetical protein C4539_19060 [Ignavibacteriales bacterium]|nr:MAG: hypothetical protein C4539_19060 [Ignavibacteriales bacterium]